MKLRERIGMVAAGAALHVLHALSAAAGVRCDEEFPGSEHEHGELARNLRKVDSESVPVRCERWGAHPGEHRATWSPRRFYEKIQDRTGQKWPWPDGKISWW